VRFFRRPSDFSLPNCYTMWETLSNRVVVARTGDDVVVGARSAPPQSAIFRSKRGGNFFFSGKRKEKKKKGPVYVELGRILIRDWKSTPERRSSAAVGGRRCGYCVRAAMPARTGISGGLAFRVTTIGSRLRRRLAAMERRLTGDPSISGCDSMTNRSRKPPLPRRAIAYQQAAADTGLDWTGG